MAKAQKVSSNNAKNAMFTDHYIKLCRKEVNIKDATTYDHKCTHKNIT